jgi:alpha-D-ribose 1-methylphosphonate 5-triphosphate synthase subunit PhnH
MSAGRLSPLASQAVFRVLLESLARPGRIFQFPATSKEAGPGIVPLALAVIGSKVAVAGAPEWQARICRATGAQPADIEAASLVAIYGPAKAEAITRLRRGSANTPEDGAKVGLACGALTAGHQGDTTIELKGPGVPGRMLLGVNGVGPEVFDALREANARFPAGVDVWLVDERGRVAGLPRSARQAVV